MAGVNFHLLGDNLSLLYSARDSDPLSALVPDPNSDALHGERSLAGRIIQIGYDVAFMFDGGWAKSERFNHCLHETKKLFSRGIEEIKKQSDNFVATFSTVSASDDLKRQARQSIISIAEAIFFLVSPRKSESLAETLDPLQAIYRKRVGYDLYVQEDQKALALLQKQYAIAAIESATQSDFPFLQIRKFMEGTALVEKDKQILQAWSDALQRCHDRISCSIIHNAIFTIAEAARKGDASAIQDLDVRVGVLELFLFSLGCTFFWQKEPSFIRWRDSLAPGSKISDMITLGKRVFIEGLILEGARAFELEGHSDKMVVFGSNTCEMMMWLAKCEFNVDEWGLHPIQCFDELSDPQGKFLVLDKPVATLRSIFTLPDPVYRALRQDDKVIESVSRAINRLSTARTTPIDLDIDNYTLHSLQDGNYKIYQIKPYGDESKTQFSFSRLERFVSALAGRDMVFHRKIMSQSKLIDHPTAQFFCKIYREASWDYQENESVAKMLDQLSKGKEVNGRDTATQAAIAQVRDPDAIDSARQMIVEVEKLKRLLLHDLLAQGQTDNELALKELVSKALVELQEATLFASQLWEGAYAILRGYLIQKMNSPMLTLPQHLEKMRS